ncbi:MAG TPA: glutamate-1-semialdehyde 2,1-aminomutase [Kofleriaceae bacterium]|nr:glutamate-1-semialdehyde 2,1-aminomutase [Kofleriaceae bacterium]
MSDHLLSRARQVIPGGVNSPVRACRSVGADPVFIASADGCRVTSATGDRFIDMVMSWGPLILGHAHPEIVAVVAETAARGTSFGAPTKLEVAFAEAICAAVPSIAKVRAVSSGTEATMSALRLARGHTGRDKILKVDGGYHGHADCLLVAAGSGAATLGIPGSAGVPAGAARDTLLVPYNDAGAVRAAFAEHGDTIAAVIVEPVAGNMGVIAPEAGYLASLREITASHGALLIFDEVITGFRVAYGGAQAHFGVRPDLTCLGKIIGGGLPAAAFGGRAEIMDCLAPDGDVYQAGTLSGNPLAMAAGRKTLELLARPGVYDRLEALGAYLEAGLCRAIAAAGIAARISRVGSAMTVFFCEEMPRDFATAKAADTARYAQFYRAMRARGVLLAPSQFEAMFVSLAHSETDLDEVIAAAAASLGELTPGR